MRPKLSIVIPCLNESKTITTAVSIAHKALKDSNLTNGEIIVADNGSTDNSPELVRQQNIAKLIRVPIKGYGAALHWGINAAKSDFIIFADADLSYNFKEISRFVPILKHNPDLVLGSRYSGKIKEGAMPFLNRYLGTPVLTLLIRLIYHLPVTDCNSGMRLVKKSFYKQLHITNSGMEWASELLIKTAVHKGSYYEVPISLSKDKRGRRPHLIPWADGWRHLKAIILLKPNILVFPAISLFYLSFLFSGFSFPLALAAFLLAQLLILTLASAKLLQFAIDKTSDGLTQLVFRFPFVPIALLCIILSPILLIFSRTIPPHLLFIWATSCPLFLLWVFFIETIKTHMINRLPQK